MKMRFLVRPLLCLASLLALVSNSSADPILAFQKPIENQLTNDLVANPGNRTLINGLNAYRKPSKSLNTDITILRNLNKTLASTAGYLTLIETAANDYQADFQSRRDAIVQQLVPAPLGVNRTAARLTIATVDKAISNAVNAASFSTRLVRLATVASKLSSASNSVQRALRSPLGFSAMTANIGRLSFESKKGSVAGSPNFQTDDGTFIGEFTTNGTLSVSAFDNASIARGILLYVQGVGSNVPAIYPLGDGQNLAYYDALDIPRKAQYHFQADNTMTNAVVPVSYLSIDFLGSNYLIGTFAFVSTNIAPIIPTDTNTIATISQGEFQLNFRRATPPPVGE